MRETLGLPDPSLTQPAETIAKIQRAQWCVGAAMSSCLALWFLPFVSGLACSAAETKLINKILRIMECYSEVGSERVLWFFRQKTFFLFGATYLPFAGVPLQLFETYGLGQFAIHCALRPDLLTDDAWLEQSWKDIEDDIFSGDHAIHSYEHFTAKPFPVFARKGFIVVVDGINRMYQTSQRIPGAERTQRKAGRVMQTATQAGMAGLRGGAKGPIKLGPLGIIAGFVGGAYGGIKDNISSKRSRQAADNSEVEYSALHRNRTEDYDTGETASANSPEGSVIGDE
jgi:hypothetical protein